MPYIPKPKKPRPKTPKYGERQDIYNTKRWRELRLSKLSRNPLCEVCKEEGKTTLAEEVHHLVSFLEKKGLERQAIAFDYNNLISVCRNCHISKFHSKEGYLKDCRTMKDVIEQIKNNKKNKRNRNEV